MLAGSVGSIVTTQYKPPDLFREIATVIDPDAASAGVIALLGMVIDGVVTATVGVAIVVAVVVVAAKALPATSNNANAMSSFSIKSTP